MRKHSFFKKSPQPPVSNELYESGTVSKLSRLVNRTLVQASRPHIWMSILFLVVFAYLILVPVAIMVWSSFNVQTGDERRAGVGGELAKVGEFTLYYWDRLFMSDISMQVLYRPLLNTFVICFSYTIIAMLFGTMLAFLMVKTDLRFKRFSGLCAIIPYILPSWTLALAWITIFGSSEIGVGAPGIFEHLTGAPTPRWLAYGPFPIIMVLAINFFAYSYLLASAALGTIDTSLEESGRLHGASNATIMRKITFPIILPALGSAMVLTFANGVGTFGVPAFLGLPVRYRVIATSLYQSAQVGRMGDVFVFTMVLIVISTVAIIGNSALIGKRKQFTTMSGKGGRQRILKLGRFRTPVSLVTAGILGLFTFLPIFLLVFQSLQYNLGVYTWENITLTYWIGERMGLQGILVSPRIRAAALNTLIYGLVVATSTAFLGMLIGYCVVKNRGNRISLLIEQISFIPFVIPGIAFGAIFLTMFAQPRGPIPVLYGTLWILFLAGMVNRLPFSSRMGISAMMQVGRTLEECSEVHGAGFVRRFRKILFPLTKRGYIGGFILAFVSSVKDLNLVILLVTPRSMVLSALTLGYIEQGRRQFADAIGVVIVIMVLVCVFLAQVITKTNPLKGFGAAGQ